MAPLLMVEDNSIFSTVITNLKEFMMIISRASVEQSANLALWLHNQGVSAEQSITWLKSKSYVIRGVRFDVARVASVITGITIGKGLATTSMKKPRKAKQTIVVEEQEELPF